MLKLLFILGTRPEAIKLYPLITQFRKKPLIFRTIVLSTGQQKELLDITLNSLQLDIDFDLALMQSNQGLSNLTSELFKNLDLKIKEISPNCIFIHGDTTTSMVSGIVAKYNKIKIIHIEAGLRTTDIMSPWPEEINRRINAITSDYHAAPTLLSAQNLLNEGIDQNKILISGNTGIDTLRITNSSIRNKELLRKYLTSVGVKLEKNFQKFILVTIHRRENIDALESIFLAIKDLAQKHKDYIIVYPVHLNPNVLNKAISILSSVTNLHLIEPSSYKHFVAMLNVCKFVITDSGGIQEEAAFLGKPTVLCRNSTERMEGLGSMNIILAGTIRESILDVCERLIEDEVFYKKYSKPSNVFGDGFASEKIYDWISKIKL